MQPEHNRALFSQFQALCREKPFSEAPSVLWNRRAENWEEERLHRNKGEERIASAMGYLRARGLLDTPISIADLGCGPGRFAAAFGKAGHTVLGLDISEKMVQYGREHLAREGVSSARLEVCDFDALDVEKAGYAETFDLVLASNSPAVHDTKSLNKMMEMSRGWCLDISHLSGVNHLRSQLLRELFGREAESHWSGKWFYALFNTLFLLGYEPETSYDTILRDTAVTPTEGYVEYLMEHMLTPEEHSAKNAARILRWLQNHANADGTLIEHTEATYGRILWDVRRRCSRPEYEV